MGKVIFNSKEDWLEFRKGKITGTTASAIIGKNPYLSNTEVWEIITNKKEPKDISEKPYVVKGKYAEEHIIRLFILDHPTYQLEEKEEEFVVFYDDDNPYIMATPDGILKNIETGETGIIEIKTCDILSSRQKESWSNNNIPINYYTQLIQEIYCSKATFGILVVELHYSDDLTMRKTYIVYANDIKEDIDWLINEEKKFFQEYVSKQKRPPLILS